MTLVVPKAIDWDNLPAPVWQRLPGESSRAFHCWCTYRDMPNKERTYEAAAEKVGINMYSMYEHAKRWHWARRLEAWENYLSDIAIKQQIEAAADMNRRHIETARLMMEKAMLRLTGREPDADGRGGIQAIPVESLTPGEVTKLAETAAKMERLALEAENQRLGIREREERSSEVVIRLAFDATPQMPGKQPAVPPVFHGHNEDDDVVDGEFTEVEPDQLEEGDDGAVCMNCGAREKDDQDAFDGGTPGPYCVACFDDPERVT